MNIAMRTNLFLLTCLLLAAASVHAVSVEPYTHSRIFWDQSSRRTVFASGGYARIIQLQDGRLMAVCENGGIQIAFSSNLGSSWSSPKRIVENTNNTPNCVPDLIQLVDGTIVVGYNPRPSEPYTTDRRFGIRCKRSTDNGRSWSDEIFVNDASYTFQDGCWEPSFLQLPSGELQLYFADEGPYTTSGDQQISLCRSFDGGQTWSTAQKVSYRAGYRDGMPVPVLLKDQSEIIVAVEDNGWGYGDFFPTTVRCPLSRNWKTYWVNGADQNRERALNLDFCPLATGGAPYLRVLPSGETVISHQSPYGNNGKIQMRVAVGNEEARDFRGVSTPFGQGPENPQGLWNSLAVIDTGIVVAVSGIAGKIEMIKGYPTRLLQAAFAHPVVDGRCQSGEGYLKVGSQVMLGTQTGTRVQADFAYDQDSLYFFARVFDNTITTSGSNADAVSLLLAIDNSTDSAPQKGCYRFQMRTDGNLVLYCGSNNSWRRVSPTNYPLHLFPNIGASFYSLEAAIPWSTLGEASPPVGRRMSAAIEVSDNRNGTVLTESIPDASSAKPWTWMEFRLQPLPDAVRDISVERSVVGSSLSAITSFDLSGRPAVPRASCLTLLRCPDGSVRKMIRK